METASRASHSARCSCRNSSARGVLAPSFVVSYSHTDHDIDTTIEAVRGALEVYRRALNDGVDKYLIGAPVKPVMRPYAS